MRLNLRLIGIIFGILCIATIGRILLYARSSNSRDKNPLPIIGIALLIIGSHRRFLRPADPGRRQPPARISRRRLVRAVHAQSRRAFRRAPKNRRLRLSVRKWNPTHAPDASHMFFGNGLGDALFGALATHPPLAERIHAIDPTWDGKFPAARRSRSKPQIAPQAISEPSPAPAHAGNFRHACSAARSSPRAAPADRRSSDRSSVLPNLGNPTPLHLKYAEKLRDALPENVKAAAREPLDAMRADLRAAVEPPTKNCARRSLPKSPAASTRPVSEKTAALFPDVSAAAHARLPMVNLALRRVAAIDARSSSNNFRTRCSGSSTATARWSCLNSSCKKSCSAISLRSLAARAQPAVQFYTLKPLVPDCAVVLSALANVGSDDAGGNSKGLCHRRAVSARARQCAAGTAAARTMRRGPA